MGRGFWLTHAYVPGLVFLVIAATAAVTRLDVALEQAWAYDVTAQRFIGAGPGEWWAKDLIHGGGYLVTRLAGAALLCFWLVARQSESLAHWRRPAGYAVAAAALSVAIAGALKATSNIDCPWSLELFGGARPYVHLFGDRPDALPRAQCFPGGHSSSGFALFALYFALRERYRAAASIVLGIALAIGVLFAFGQQARGAHFFSHDLWSAAIAWFSSLGVYALGFQGRLWGSAAAPAGTLVRAASLEPLAGGDPAPAERGTASSR